LEVLRRGAESTVYRALTESGDERVVLKVMRGANGAAEVERLRELSGLPGVVRMVDDGLTSSGRPFAALEHLPEGDYGRRAPLPVDEAVEVGRSAARALEAVHALGLLHHAVEPENLLVSAEGAVLADAGAVLPAESVPPEVGLSPDALRYAPPEALRGEPHSAASDVYRLAATLWTLLAGHAPFDGDPNDPFGHRERVLTGAPPPPPRDDVPAAVAGVLLRGLSKDPVERFATAGAFAEALVAAAATPHAAPDLPLPPADPGTDEVSEADAGAPEPEGSAWWEVGGEPSADERSATVESSPAQQAPAEASSDVEAPAEGSAWWEAVEESSAVERSSAVEPPSAREEPAEAPPAAEAAADGSAWWEAAEEVTHTATARREPDRWDEAEETAVHAADDGWARTTDPEERAGSTGAEVGAGSARTDRFGPEIVAASSVGRDDRPSAPVRGGDPWGGLDDEPGPAVSAPASPPPLPLQSPGESPWPAPSMSRPLPSASPETRVRATPLPDRTWPRYAAVAGAALVLAVALVGVVAFLLPGPGGGDPDGSEAAPSAPPSDGESPPPPAGVAEGAEPTGVTLDDSGDTVVVTWEDNTGGDASHHIVGGPVGTVPSPLTEVGPGETEARAEGLDADEEYCFTVIAVVSVDEVAYSEQACTARNE
jgi:serine/threonine protein kinase